MKHLLTLTDLNKNDINQILEIATQMRRIVEANYKKSSQLLGSVVAGLWPKPCVSSTAFSLATSYLSGTPLPIIGAEDLLSQCQYLDNMGANTIVISCDNDNLSKSFATKSRASVINGSSSQYDPIGVLADIMALRTKLDGLQNLSVLAVGNRDVNKINELNYCLQLFDSSLVWYLPVEDFVTPRRGIILDKIEPAFFGADAVIDLGLSSFSDSTKYYGTSGGIAEWLMDKARIRCPLLGSRHIVDKTGVKPYPYNIVDTREVCYVSVAMAVLHLLRNN